MATNGADQEAPLLGDVETLAINKKISWSQFVQPWLMMGWVAFGGPTAHIGYFQKLFVERYKWLTHGIFVELLALGQCLPGPTSTQMAFAIGVCQKGVSGGLLSGGLFLYPGLVMMSLVGLGAASILTHPTPLMKGVVEGLAVTGVALVASAGKNLVFSVCKTRLLALICAFSTVAAYYHNTAWLFPVLLLLGGLVSCVYTYLRPNTSQLAGQTAEEHAIERSGFRPISGALLIVAWAGILITVMVLKDVYDYEQAAPLHWFELFYRTGSLIFGGGQIVLPLLLSEIVHEDCSDPSKGCVPAADTWLTKDEFYTGLAAAQAMPGPLFNFSAYLGAMLSKRTGYNPALGIALCWLGLFGPGIMLIFGVLPFWSKFRHWELYRKALPGLNSAAVGLIASAVISMVYSVTGAASIFPKASVCIGIIGFAAVDVLDVPAPLAVVFGGVLGGLAHTWHLG